MRPTLQTVADTVGVSRSTVSNAYSRPDQLSPLLREKIFAAARRLGYSGPDPTARSLRRGRIGAVGVLFTDTLSYAFTDPYALQFLRGLAEAAEQEETGLLLMPLSADDEQAAAKAVQNAAVDGFCVYCVTDWHRSLAAAKARGLPVVSTARPGEGDFDILYAGIDEAAATRPAAEHLARLGHRRIAAIAHWPAAGRQTRPRIVVPDDVAYGVNRERLQGYREAFDEAGIGGVDLVIVKAAGNSRAAGAAAAAHVLDRDPRPTAVLALSDLLALGVLDALNARGLGPGHDVSVIGFDDIPEAATAGLTTIRQPAMEKGHRAGELLLNPPPNPAARHVVLPTELIVRASTGPSPTRRT